MNHSKLDIRAIPSPVLAGSLSNLLLFLGNLGVTFFLTPFLAARLGDASYGRWAFVESLAAYFTLLDLGISTCLIRFIAAKPADEWHRTIGTAFWSLAAVAGVGFLLVIPLSLLFEQPIFLLLCLFPVATGLPMGVYPAALDGMGATAAKSAIRLGLLIAKTVALVVAMTHQPTLICLGIVLAVFALAEQLLLALCAFSLCRVSGVREKNLSIDSASPSPPNLLPRSGGEGGKIFPSLHSFDEPTFRELAGLSKHAFLAMLAGRISLQSGPVLLGLLLGAPHVAWYAIAFRLVETGKNALRTMTSTLTAAFGNLAAKSDMRPIRTLYKHAVRWTLYAAIPLQVGIWYWGEWFLRSWMPNEEYAREGGPVLRILALTLTLGMAQSVAVRILHGLGDLKFFARIALWEAGTGVLSALILIPPFGLKGLAWAIAAPNALACLWILKYTHRRIEIGLWEYLEQWLPPYLCGLSLNFFWMAALMLRPPVGNAVLILAGIAVYASCTVLVEGRRLQQGSAQLQR